MAKKKKRKHGVVRDGQVGQAGQPKTVSHNFFRKKPKSKVEGSGTVKIIPEYQMAEGKLELEKIEIKTEQAKLQAKGYSPSLDLKIKEDDISREQMAIRNDTLSQLKGHPANDLNLAEPLNKTETISVVKAHRDTKAREAIKFDAEKASNSSVKITDKNASNILDAYNNAGITTTPIYARVVVGEFKADGILSIKDGKPFTHHEIRKSDTGTVGGNVEFTVRGKSNRKIKANAKYPKEFILENKNPVGDKNQRKRNLHAMLKGNAGLDHKCTRI